MFDIISAYLDIAWEGIAAVGWYIVGLVLVLLYTGPRLREIYDKWKRKSDEAEYAAKYHKDVDLYQERLTQMEIARQKMQEKYSEDAEKAKQRELERIAKKKQALLDLTNGQNGGQKLGQAAGEASTSTASSSSSSSSLKQGYNPLMGDTGRGYRAPKRSCCGKGGCG